jgi:hypothetical protein
MSDATTQPQRALWELLADGISDVAAMHPECDLSHPGTPSAGVAMARLNGQQLEYVVLADTVIVFRTHNGEMVITDDRVKNAASEDREAASALPYDSAERKEALRRMKRRERSLRNRLGGYWGAAADPIAAEHSIPGSISVSTAAAIAVLTNGAARCVTPFELMSWADGFRVLDCEGPASLIHRIREVEKSDYRAERWQRTKRSDDATGVHATLP